MKTEQKQVKVKVGDIISCDDFSWNVRVDNSGLAKDEEAERRGRHMIPNLTVLALAKEGFPTADSEGNVSTDPERILVSGTGQHNTFGSSGSRVMNDMMVQDMGGTVYFLRSDLIPKGVDFLREELEKKQTAIEKWDKVIEDIDAIHERIATPCGFCRIYAEPEGESRYDKSDCPLWVVCAGCRGGADSDQSEYHKTLDTLREAEKHADRMRRAIVENVDACKKELDC